MQTNMKLKNEQISDPEKDKRRSLKLFTEKDSFEYYVRSAVNQVLYKDKGIEYSSESLIQLIVKQYPIDISELEVYTKGIVKKNSKFSNERLGIILLQKVASNTKYKKMGKIAKEMLKERWWEKNE
ncbi:hypothetical protein ACIP97_13925 [Peribacillus frigoritolerans]|uniref:hypothetical protein n=1 Tax=Peribacillus frigoritolerans TaxID=450367 RepID=UPI0038221582